MKQNFNTIANNIKLFGWLFSDVHIRRKAADGTMQDIHVPISYMGKERMFYLINNTQTDLSSPKIDGVYPMMGYELKDFKPDWERMTNPYQTISNDFELDGTLVVETELNKIPAIFSFSLSIAAIHQTDLFHILEQMLPLFRPSYTLKANLNPQLGETQSDVTFLYRNGQFTDFNEEAPFGGNSEKPIVYTLDFDVKSWLWTPNDEDDAGGGIFGKPIREIELGVFVQKEPFTKEQLLSDDSYTWHIPEHIPSPGEVVEEP